MKIEININEKGIITTCLTRKSFIKYVSYQKKLQYILQELKSIKKVNIRNGTIEIITELCSILIKNYKNNKSESLKKVIYKAIDFKKEERKKYLRKKKIQRNALIGVTIIVISILSQIIKEEIKKIFEEETNPPKDPIKSEKIVDETPVPSVSFVDEEETSIETESKEESITEVAIEFKLDYEDRTNDEKYIKTKDNYYSLIKEIAEEYGIDPRIMLAIATQEKGEHTIDISTPAIGLMQLEKSVWDGKTITAFNYKLNREENVKITVENLKDIRFNIKVACMYFQKCLYDSNNNLIVAIQMYNYGYGNMRTVFEQYLNKPISDLRKVIDINDVNWMNYRYVINVGDSQYLEKIISYIEDKENIRCKTNESESCYRIKQSVKNLTLG